VTPFYTICSSIPLLGGFGALDGTGQFMRTYTGLPSHVYVVGTISLWMLDQRSGIPVVVKAGNLGLFTFMYPLANLVSTPSAWKSDLCGDPNLPDAANVKFTIRFQHTGDTLSLWIYNQGFPSNSYFGVRDLNLIFLNSVPLSAPYRCGNSDPPELLGSAACPCSLHYYSDGTNCQKCHDACGNCYGPSASECYDCSEGYIFQGSQAKCVPCHSSCKSCFGTASNQCKACSDEAYMTSSQTCINKCTFPMIYEEKNNADYCGGPCGNNSQFYYPQEKTCKSSCPKPYTADQTMGYSVCSPESENTSADKVKEVTGQIANAGIILANTLSMGSSSGITLAVFAEILDYIKYMNILYSADLELALLTWKSSFLFLKFAPDLPDSAKRKFDDNPPSSIFVKYGVDSSFLVNFFESLMSILIIASALATLGLLEKSTEKNKTKWHQYIQKVRYLVQNFLLTMIYNAYGGVFFFAILQFKAIKFTSSLSVLSFVTSVLCLMVGTFVLCWHLLLLLKQEDIRKNNPPETWEKQFEKFDKENQGFLTLFGDFKKQKFNQQAFLLFFTLRQILLSVTITTLYAHPVVESITFLTISVTMVVYLIVFRPIQDTIDLISQIYNEIIVVTVNISLVIMSVQDRFHQGSHDSRNRLSDMIIMLSLIFNSSITLFLAAKGIRWVYCYIKAKKAPSPSEKAKQIIQKSTTLDDGTKKKLQLAAIRNHQISEAEKNDLSSQNYFRESSSFSLRNIDHPMYPERFINPTLALPESLQTQEQSYSEPRMHEPPLKRPKIKKTIRPNKIYNQQQYYLNDQTNLSRTNFSLNNRVLGPMTLEFDSQNSRFFPQDNSRIKNNSLFYETNFQDK